MSERAAFLAAELQQAIAEVDQFIDDVPDDGWQAFCPGEQCTVAALICHIGYATQGMFSSIILPVAEGTSRPDFSREELDRWNAHAAQQYAAATRDEAREILQSQSAPVIAYVRELTGAQLATAFELSPRPEPITLDAMITYGLIGHPREHLASARAAAGLTG